jgi:hypothetical protein
MYTLSQFSFRNSTWDYDWRTTCHGPETNPSFTDQSPHLINCCRYERFICHLKSGCQCQKTKPTKVVNVQEWLGCLWWWPRSKLSALIQNRHPEYWKYIDSTLHWYIFSCESVRYELERLGKAAKTRLKVCGVESIAAWANVMVPDGAPAYNRNVLVAPFSILNWLLVFVATRDHWMKFNYCAVKYKFRLNHYSPVDSVWLKH